MASTDDASSADVLMRPDAPPKEAKTDLNALLGIPSAEKTAQLGGELTDLKRREGGEVDALTKKNEARTDRLSQQIEQQWNATAVQPGDFPKWNARDEHEKHSTDPLVAFGSLGSVFGMIASAFTHAPMENAMNASAAAMNAIRVGDEKEYERAFEAFKTNTDLTFKRYQLEREHLQDGFRLMDTDMRLGEAKLRSTFARFGMKRELAMAEAGMWPEIYQAQSAQADAMTKMQDARLKLEERGFQRGVFDREVKQIESQNVPPEEKAALKLKAFNHFFFHNEKAQSPELQQMGEFMWEHRFDNEGKGPTFEQMNETWKKIEEAKQRFLKSGMSGPVAAASIAGAIKSGEQPPTLTGLYGQSPAVRAELANDHFDLAKAQLEWQRAQKQVASLNGPQMTRFAGLAESVVNTIDEVKMLAQDMQLKSIPIVNQAQMLAYIQAQGDTENSKTAVRYMAAVNTLKEEFANLANGGYAPTEPAWKLANEQINGNYSVGKLTESLDEVQRLIRYRIHGLPNWSALGPNAPNRYKGGDSATPSGEFGLPEGWKVETR